MTRTCGLLVAFAALLLAAPVSAQDLILNNQTVTLGGVHSYGTVSLTNSKILVPAFNGTDKVSTGNLQIRATSITIDASSSIIADGRGYQPKLCDNGRAPSAFPSAGGRGGCSVLDSGGGGAHFGIGGRGTKDCFCYGDASSCQFPQEFEEACGHLNSAGNDCVNDPSGEPTGTCPTANGQCYNNNALPSVAGQSFWHSIYVPEFGAAGGDKGCRDGFDSCSVGGAGGGRIVLAAVSDTAFNGVISISGRVSAEGKRGCGSGNDSGGGGAGGTIVLAADKVTVSGTAYISAAGGLGGDTRGDVSGNNPDCHGGCFQQGGTCDDCGGGGGGGIISVLSRQPASLASTAVFNVRGAEGGTCPICKGEAGGGAGELQLSGVYTGELCDGHDNDFDGQTDEGLGTVSCGSGACQSTVQSCGATGVPNDCLPLASPSCMDPLTDSRPRFLVIVDSSGSMLTDLNAAYTFGDGSAGHAGLDTNSDGVANDSRLFKAKAALTNVISAYPEINFAIARYSQGVGDKVNCQLAHWFECAGLCCTYDDPTNNTGVNPEGPCTISKVGSHAPVTVLPTSKGEECINYAGSCGSPRRGADILVGFERPISQSLMWLDNKETAFKSDTAEGNHCAGGDCELRGTGPTPLADALHAAKAYLAKVMALDTVAGCRKYSVILLTDGAETCQGNPAQAAAQLFAAGIQTFVVGFSVLAGEQTSLNQIAASGGTGAAYFAANETQLAAALASIVAKSVMFEKCNGKDDNCNGLCDEDWPEVAVSGATCTNKHTAKACSNGKLGACARTGAYVCKADGTGTVCNAPDATGSAEICDGLDNNCNGLVDEGLPNCVPPLCLPEICDGKDNDCDGAIDDNIPSVPCGKDVGECKAGMSECTGGKSICKGGTEPKLEVCNGLDDDCDGVRDGGGQPCYSFTTGCDLKTLTCKGICKLGLQICSAVQAADGTWSGQWGACSGDAGPQTEICDGLDNDCDGAVDQGAECPGGGECIAGACSQPCGGVEFSCPKGQLCKNGWCVLDPCDPVACETQNPAYVCKNGECIDACANVSCDPKTETCVKGVCVDVSCYSKGCPPGERCVAGVCQPDPCAAISCGAGEFCQSGKCIRLCDTINCPPGEVCRVEAGTPRCFQDPCAQIKCEAGQICAAGKCVVDPCSGVSCAKGEVCQGGSCVPDVCERTRCPSGFHCVRGGECVPSNVQTTTDLLATGAGGCACTAAGGEGAGWPVLLILMTMIRASRRRRRRP